MKRPISIILTLVVLICLVTATAGTAGTPSDPLLSRSYLNSTFLPGVKSDASAAADSALGSIYDSAYGRAKSLYDSAMPHAGYSFAAGFCPVSIPKDGTLALTFGSSFVLTSGSASILVTGGALIDVTTGSTANSGSMAIVNHRYFCAEGASVTFIAGSALTGQVDGYYKVTDTSTLPFTDVPGGAWFYDAIRFVYQRGLFAGTSADAFSPETAMTRGMFVTVLYRLAGSPGISHAASFDDVRDQAQYYYNAVSWADDNHIVTGYDDGKFYPNVSISREQMALIMYRYTVYKGVALSIPDNSAFFAFPDTDKVSPYAYDAMMWAVSLKIINGSDGQLRPADTATRAQVAQVLMNFCNQIPGM